jgi:predicted GH43/DUF377 family glycosyl hydrolase
MKGAHRHEEDHRTGLRVKSNMGEPGKGVAEPGSRVVFTCGAVRAKDRQVFDLDDKVLVYYGDADIAIGVATGRVCDLVLIFDQRPLR